MDGKGSAWTRRERGSVAYLVRVLLPLLLPLLFLLNSVPTGYLLEGPGPSFDLQSGLTVEGMETYPARGEFLLTSVSLRESRLVFHLFSLLDRDLRLLEVQQYLGKDLDVEGQDRVEEVMTTLSRSTAAVVGLRQVGVEVEVQWMGALVVTVLEGYPAYGKLRPGEVVVSVDGVPVAGAAELSELIDASPEGREVSLGVREMDWEGLETALASEEEADLSGLLREEVRETTLFPVWDDKLGKKVLGVSIRDFFAYRAPVRVEWEMDTVRGPSAGLMMTLSLVNALVPEDLTRGLRIAGTGEISLDGRVGPIGGLPMKVRAAEARGAEVFLYPRENQEDLAGITTSMRMVPVGSLQEALDALSSDEVEKGP